MTVICYYIYYCRFLQSSEGSRNTIRDKAAELEAMKAQLTHIKALMEDSTRIRDSIDSTSEIEQDDDANSEGAAEITEDENVANISFERQSDGDDIGHGKIRNSGDRPTIEDMQVIIIIVIPYCGCMCAR